VRSIRYTGTPYLGTSVEVAMLTGALRLLSLPTTHINEEFVEFTDATFSYVNASESTGCV
jgi:hypothetical protein